MRTKISTVLTFGRDGNASEFQTSGWYGGEDGYTWTSGDQSSILLEAPVAPFGYYIEIDWNPILNPPHLCGQTVLIEINRKLIKTYQVTRSGMVAFRCESPEQDEEKLNIVFRHPDFIRPCDFIESTDSRKLSLSFRRIRLLIPEQPWETIKKNSADLAIRSLDIPSMIVEAEHATGKKLDSLLNRFEMLSGNCDMGLAFRALGYENLSLLRFAGATPLVADKGLETNFSDLATDIDATIADNPIREWMINDRIGLTFHTGQSSEMIDKEKVLKRFKSYANILLRKFLEDLDAGQKIFIYADHKYYGANDNIEEVLPIFLSLRRRSNAKMLWVYASRNNGFSRGSVQEIIPGLAQASLDILAPPILVGGGITVSGWLTIICNADSIFKSTEYNIP